MGTGFFCQSHFQSRFWLGQITGQLEIKPIGNPKHNDTTKKGCPWFPAGTLYSPLCRVVHSRNMVHTFYYYSRLSRTRHDSTGWRALAPQGVAVQVEVRAAAGAPPRGQRWEWPSGGATATNGHPECLGKVRLWIWESIPPSRPPPAVQSNALNCLVGKFERTENCQGDF